MEGEIDPFDFILAESLHMTVQQVREMSNLEHTEWRAFYVYRNAMVEFEKEKAKGKR